MKKPYNQPTIRVTEMDLRTTLLTASQFPDKAGINNEPGTQDDFE